ncbi:MAG: family 20 glycosylhydrolase [Phycisphaerales bacterium]|nr:family 20 glycosylhydrolase [Phycisphaerales bacterium]
MVPNSLLPAPSRDNPTNGHLELVEPIVFTVQARDPRVARAAARCTPFPAVVAQAGEPRPAHGGTPVHVRVTDDSSPAESYSLAINAEGVSIRGHGRAGAFYGLQTLHQISRTDGRRWRCRIIDDQPDLPLRGLSLDVSRGRIPTLERLFGLVDRLAAVKINHLQLYVEHTFDFQFDPDIARSCSPLTDDDIRALDAFCRDRFINLVPSLATFGHMGRILGLPRYAHLAEIPAAAPWESQPWPTRIRGLTIDARNPDARCLIECMLDEYLPLFSSDLVNVNADETHDLGRGRNADYCKQVGRGRLYVDHLNLLIDACRRRGKRAMFWGDVIRNHPDLLPELDGDAVLLDWGYDAESDFPAVRSPERVARDVIVCPGTSGWNRVLNGLNTADANITRAAQTASEHRAAGMVVTDWGDDGHFNLLACSMPAILRAAALGWNAGSSASDIDFGIEHCLFGPDAAGLLDLIRDAGRPGDRHLTWRLLYQPWTADAWAGIHASFQHDRIVDSVERARSALSRAPVADAGDRREWNVALDAGLLFAKTTELTAPTTLVSRDATALTAAFRSHVHRFAEEYAAVWNAHNRPHRLHDIITKLNDLSDPARIGPPTPPPN